MQIILLPLISILVFPISYIYSEPSCLIDDSKEKLYRLDLTVPATFCKKTNKDPSCKTFPKKSILQLHGLWPNYTIGFPEGKCKPNECKTQSEKKGKFCKFPEPTNLYSSNDWKLLSKYMAGTEKCLERHEWVKHGVCSPMDSITYFKWALERTKEITSAFDIFADKLVTQEEVNTLVSKNLPLLNGAIRFSCKGENVSGVFVLYEWGNIPGNPIKTKGGNNGFGNCPNRFIFPSSPE